MRNISISILSCDFLHLENEIQKINNSDAVSGIHFDVMDGVFVPNISFGFDIMQKVVSVAQKPCAAHLMIKDPLKYIGKCASFSLESVIVHYREDYDYLKEVHEACQKLNLKAGIALNPEDDPNSDQFKKIAPMFNDVLIMTVSPGFGGQKMDEANLSKIEIVKTINPDAFVTIDGGVKFSHIESIEKADAFVIGSDFYAK